jgi:hypothetical protein
MTAKILVLDVETQRAIVETFSIWRPFIHIDRVIKPTRLLCFAAKWRGSDEIIFKHAWDDDNPESYTRMLQAAYDLLNEADIVVTWNGDRFDIQWFESELGRLELGRPAPYKSLDLIKINKRWFKGGQMSMKLDWSSRQWLKDQKLPHSGTDLWHDIRYGTRAERRAAQKTMKEYNIQDVNLTERLLERYLPYATGINLALYEDNDDGKLHCTKCFSTNLKRDGVKLYRTTAFSYQMHRCKDCGATSRGKRSKLTTELRPV